MRSDRLPGAAAPQGGAVAWPKAETARSEERIVAREAAHGSAKHGFGLSIAETSR